MLNVLCSFTPTLLLEVTPSVSISSLLIYLILFILSLSEHREYIFIYFEISREVYLKYKCRL